MPADEHRTARHEVQRLIGQLVALVEDGEHLGAPVRSEGRIVIPLVPEPAADAVDDVSVRALLAAWLDHPPPAE